MFLAAALFAMFYQPASAPEFYIIPAPVQINVTSATYADIKGYQATNVKETGHNVYIAKADVKVSTPAPVSPPAAVVPSGCDENCGPACYSYTNCLNVQHGSDYNNALSSVDKQQAAE